MGRCTRGLCVGMQLGVLFFLFEFFDDQLLAFLVLLSLWCAELFSVLGYVLDALYFHAGPHVVACVTWVVPTCARVRTVTSIRIFPRVVLLAYVLFLVYFLSHPLGFSYIALATSFCYVTVTYARASMPVKGASHTWLVWSLVAQFCMCALWNEHELPALQGGRISAAQPRQLEEAGVVNFGGESHPPCFAWHTCMPTFHPCYGGVVV